MSRRHMADFMGQNPGDFRLVIGEGQQPAGDVNIAARQGEGIDNGGVQNGETPGQIAHFRDEGEPQSDIQNIIIQARLDIFAAILRHDPIVLLRPDFPVIIGLEDGKDIIENIRLCRVCGSQGGSANKREHQQPAPQPTTTAAHCTR